MDASRKQPRKESHRPVRRVRVFAASASDTATERAKVAAAAAALKPLADHIGVALDVVDWGAVVPDMGRPEQVILDQLKPTDWDVFVGILWHRFGTPPGGQNPRTRREYLSGTEEEFQTAFDLWEQHGRPRVLVYRCTRPIPPDALDPEQFGRVRDFFARFNATGGEHPGLYQTFDAAEAFERLLLDNLQRLLLEYAERAGSPVDQQTVQSLAPKAPDNLPRRASFFGRNAEMEKVLRALSPADRTWGVLVDGIGGIGKTAIAVEAAHRLKERGAFDAFVFVSAKQNILKPAGIDELRPAARTLDEFLNETARVLGRKDIPQLSGDERRRALLDALRETRTLLVYDNLETLTKEEQESIADFLRDLPQGCKAVITSRRRGGEGAVWLRLEKLDWDTARQIIADEATRSQQLSDKLQRAGEARWPELYDATGGSPLALSHTLGLMRVRAALTFDGALAMLRGNRSADLQQFIFQEAQKELTTNDVSALRALSFFAPSAPFEAWADVAQLSRTELETTIDRLGALSLVDVLVGGERYALHPLTRNFVRGELLADSLIAHEMGMSFAKYWSVYAGRYGGTGENYKTYGLIEAEWLNISAAAAWLWQAAEVRDTQIGRRDAAQTLDKLAQALCDAAGPLYYVGRWDERLQLSIQAYEAIRAVGEWDNAGWRAYNAAWSYYFSDSGVEEFTQWADRCSEAWDRSASQRLQALAKSLRGAVAQEQKDYTVAEKLYQEALASSQELGDEEDIAASLNDLAGLEHEQEAYDAADRYSLEALAVYEKLDSKEGIAVQYHSLGESAYQRGRLEEAREWFEKALPLAREIGRLELISEIRHSLALVHEKEGRPDLALPLAQEALAIDERLRHRNLSQLRELVERLKKKLGVQ